MSYARFLDGDVYVFTSPFGIECCMCLLVPRHWVDAPDSFLGGYLEQDNPDDTETYPNNAAMIEHLEQHRAVGHDVPEYAFERLRDPQDEAENLAFWANQRKDS